MKYFYRNIIIVVFFICSLIFFSSNFVKKDIVILDIDKEISVKTVKPNVKKLLSKYNIELKNADKVIPSVNTKLEDGMEIQVVRSFPVNIFVGEEKLEFYTTSLNVKKILNEADILVGDLDRVYPRLEENIKPDKKIEIIKVEKKDISVQKKSPYYSYSNRKNSLKAGEEIIEEVGSFGENEITYEVIYENGKEIFRERVGFLNSKKSINENVSIGKEKYLVMDDGEPYRYSKVMNMVATAYDLSYVSCGKYPDHPAYGITYSGTKARPGVIAVDPRVINLKSKVYVQSLDYTRDYGFSSAEDTGSAIKGNRIDLFIGNNRAALRYGKRSVRVYVLDEVIEDNLIVGYAY